MAARTRTLTGTGARIPLGAGLAAAACLFAGGCDKEGKTTVGADVAAVDIADRRFFLELALDNEARFRGLSGRTHIEEDGGMLFVFPRPAQLNFVMRDCPIPIDIMYLDPTGRVVAMHEMTPEEPQRSDESEQAYEQRLKLYPSRYSAQFVVELRGGTLDVLDVKEGDKVKLDTAGLKTRAK